MDQPSQSDTNKKYRHNRKSSSQSLPPILPSQPTHYDMFSTATSSSSHTSAFLPSATSPGSPPTKKPKQEILLRSSQPNISYTRENTMPSASSSHITSGSNGTKETEDERFLRLARDALVATAKGVSDRQVVDPTILDLLTRLQYASSPHGNPISNLNRIEANESGQLNIQGFYSQFPNLSNDIFTGNINRSSGTNTSTATTSQNDPGWNFLLEDSFPHLQQHQQQQQEQRHQQQQEQRHQQQQEQRQQQRQYQQHHQQHQLPQRSSQVNLPQSIAESRRTSEAGSGGEERRFPCDKCTMSFRRSSDLKRHEKQHLSIPPNICDICGKGFARKDALKRHKGTLTCKRNSEKKLYIDNLNYLDDNKRGGGAGGGGGNNNDDDEDEDDDAGGIGGSRSGSIGYGSWLMQ